jgi:large subunit ribosomal protein L21
MSADSETNKNSTEKSASSSKKSKANARKVSLDKPFAIVASGGKQFLVQEGNTIRMGKLDAEAGSSLTVSQVLLVGTEGDKNLKVGAPSVSGASVKLKVLRHARAKKVIIFKKKRRKGYTKKQGHRQDYTEVLVESISF